MFGELLIDNQIIQLKQPLNIEEHIFNMVKSKLFEQIWGSAIILKLILVVICRNGALDTVDYAHEGFHQGLSQFLNVLLVFHRHVGIDFIDTGLASQNQCLHSLREIWLECNLCHQANITNGNNSDSLYISLEVRIFQNDV